MNNRRVSQAVILAGGKATRLSSINGDSPKILTEINGISVLEDQIRQLVGAKVTNILLLLGHGAEEIKAKAQFLETTLNVKIKTLGEAYPLGTGGAVINALRLGFLEPFFVLIHGDIVFRTGIQKFIEFFENSDSQGSIMVHPSSHIFDSDLVELSEDQTVKEIHTKPRTLQPLIRNLGNAGIYTFSREVFASAELLKSDLDRDLLPRLVSSGVKILGYRNTGYVRDMGTVERLMEVTRQIANIDCQQKRSAVFLDRDGTLNIHKGHIQDFREISLYQDAIDLIRRCNQERILVLVITNQPVIARGAATFFDLKNIHAKIDNLLSEHGSYIDDYFVCPHHPEIGFRGEVESLKIDCECRKPKTKLVDEAVKRYDIDLKHSVFIGDTWRDYQTGINMGIESLLVDRSLPFSCYPVLNSLDEFVLPIQ
jgi:mannose-1-phosphate guanylyltransferase/phosphomannomutase